MKDRPSSPQGTVTYAVAANGTSSTRVGILTVENRAFTITQAGAACTFSLSSISTTIAAAGGTGGTAVSGVSGCAWTAVSNAAWISVTSGASGTDNGPVAFSVDPNPNTTTRTGTLTIAGRTFTVTQQGQPCSYMLSPTSFSPAAAGQSLTVTVTTGSNCSWVAASPAS